MLCVTTMSRVLKYLCVCFIFFNPILFLIGPLPVCLYRLVSFKYCELHFEVY